MRYLLLLYTLLYSVNAYALLVPANSAVNGCYYFETSAYRYNVYFSWYSSANNNNYPNNGTLPNITDYSVPIGADGRVSGLASKYASYSFNSTYNVYNVVGSVYGVSPASSYVPISDTLAIPNSTANNGSCGFLHPPSCTAPQYLDTTTNTCVTPPTCTAPQILDSVTHTCVAPPPTCTQNQFLDANNTCQDITTPATMPQDANASHGAYSSGYAPVPQSSCNSTSSPDYSTSLGAYHIGGWDYASSQCVALAFKCNNGFIYDSASKNCTPPPSTKDIASNTNASDSANSCKGNKWGLTWTYNFCGKCTGGVGIWLPPLGLENYGLQCNNKYVEYDCVSDYRLKKFNQVSCGNVLPKDKTTKQLDSSSLNTSPTKDTNLTSLSAVNSTTAITAKLSKQIEQNKQLNTKVSTADNQNKILDSLNKLGTKLDQINNGKLSQDGLKNAIKNGVKDALNNRDNNLSIPSDMNKSGTPGGKGISGFKNSIISQYNKRYDLFGVSTCGTLSVTNRSISFMQTTIQNPLVIMDDTLKPYYSIFKSFFLIVATFLGLVSIFRR